MPGGLCNHLFTHPILKEPRQNPQVLASDDSGAQWRALQLARWLFEQPDCATYVTRRLSASACCGDRSIEFAAALVIRYLAEASACSRCGTLCPVSSDNHLVVYST